MVERINEHEFVPDHELLAYMAAANMDWVSRGQVFTVGDWDWDASIRYCLDGKWKATYQFDDGAVGMHARRWEGPKFDDPVACLIHAKLENWGNLHGHTIK